MFSAAEAEVPHMSGAIRGSGARQGDRSWAGLGAITAMFFTVVAYATAFGMIALTGAVRALVTGQAAGARTILALVLLSPAALILGSIHRHRRPGSKPGAGA